MLMWYYVGEQTGNLTHYNQWPIRCWHALFMQCLLVANSEQRAQIIAELLEDPQELRHLVLHSYGNYAVKVVG